MAPSEERDLARAGRWVGVAGAALGLGLVAVLLSRTALRLALEHLPALLGGLVLLGRAVWWLGPRTARAVARRRRPAVLWIGPLVGVTSLAAGAVGLALAAFVSEGLGSMGGTSSAIESYLYKPVVMALAYGGVPAAVFGLGCASVLKWITTSRGPRA
jgi:hypothetical protein